MAYSAPRTWDGTETSHAAYLEVMRENNKALHDRLPKVNLGFYGAVVNGSGVANQQVWIMQHRLRYLHYHFQAKNDNVDEVKLYVTADLSSLGTNRVSHGGSYVSDEIMSSAGGDSGTAVDLNALTVGNWYFVVVQLDGTGPQLYVLNLYESSES